MIAAIEYESLPGYTRYLKLDRLDDQMVTKARQIFDRYVDDGLVIEGRFEDDDWMLSNQKGHAGLHFRINELEYKAAESKNAAGGEGGGSDSGDGFTDIPDDFEGMPFN